MNTKTINTRIGLKYDLYANWQQVENEFKPLKGEVIFYEIPAAAGAVVQEPAILFKVGDGTKTLGALPWGSAIAADVYAWAKQQRLLGGTYTEGTEGAPGTWTFDETTNTTIIDTRGEVAAFIKQETANIKIKVEQLTAGENDGKYQTYISNDGGVTWEATGAPFEIELTDYKAGNGISLDNENKFSIQLKTGENVDSNLEVDENGLSAKVATVTYTAASTTDEGTTSANLTANGTGLLDETAVGAIKSYVDAKAAESNTYSDVTLSTQQTAESGFLSTYVLSQGGAEVGKINIPKDFLVKSAFLVEATEANPIEGQTSGKYIKFIINTKDASPETGGEALYLNVTDLCDVYTAENQTGYVTLAIDDNNNITATANIKSIVEATEDQNGLATALDVKTFVGEQLAANVPNVVGSVGNAVTVTDGENSKTVSLKLNDENGNVSGLRQSEAGLEIDDEIEWVLNCGGAPIVDNTAE